MERFGGSVFCFRSAFDELATAARAARARESVATRLDLYSCVLFSRILQAHVTIIHVKSLALCLMCNMLNVY